MSDTPVGLAAYILEKYSTWTNREFKKLADGGLTQKYSLDALLDNIMIYWITNSITTSQRLYFESFNSASMKLNRWGNADKGSTKISLKKKKKGVKKWWKNRCRTWLRPTAILRNPFERHLQLSSKLQLEIKSNHPRISHFL